MIFHSRRWIINKHEKLILLKKNIESIDNFTVESYRMLNIKKLFNVKFTNDLYYSEITVRSKLSGTTKYSHNNILDKSEQIKNRIISMFNTEYFLFKIKYNIQ